jgi:L-ascorbate metabolism protein UlaG (beta-lactamase superfamily)
MRVQWYGQSAFRLCSEDATVVIDPFGDVSGFAARGIVFEYPAIEGVAADLVLVTHEHADHNGADTVLGDPAVIRSTAGTLDSPVGEVVAIASEHDDAAGTVRGPNTIFAFELGGVRIAHLGDFGQRSLREEQAAAIGAVELLFVPVGGGPTIGGAGAAAIVERLRPRVVVPMHYRTARTNFLEDAEGFLALMGEVRRLDAPSFEIDARAGAEQPLAMVPAAP